MKDWLYLKYRIRIEDKPDESDVSLVSLKLGFLCLRLIQPVMQALLRFAYWLEEKLA